MNRRILMLVAVLSAGCAMTASLNAQIPDEPDLTQCDNCRDFPPEWLAVKESERLDLDALPPDRRFDFLIGEWELLFPYKNADEGILYTTEDPIGFDVFTWRDPSRKIIDGFQEWPFTGGGRFPFRARTEFRYVEREDRWQMTWLTNSSTAFFTGGLEADGVIALYEFEPAGDRRNLTVRPGMKYVLRNITGQTFLAEEWQSADGGQTFTILKWRLLYRRRAN